MRQLTFGKTAEESSDIAFFVNVLELICQVAISELSRYVKCWQEGVN
ncbi:hypothetical protein OPS25_10590 [Alteromonas ponticola]|uniref:Four helix bundle protein n=1 Tax=Alteromonas aquimaris TaxID=2998417 RepID=A0ABT3P845_9ALTE|nr:hypothetical protein [Alteromonas aquimaris]MCW8108940.1 hypothetical protein [Alteromonas aquimaris]